MNEKDWVQVTDGGAVDEERGWSPDGNVLHFVSERDGFRCLWARITVARDRILLSMKEISGNIWMVKLKGR